MPIALIEKIVGLCVTETNDWSSYVLANQLTGILTGFSGKPYFYGSSFEAGGIEYQVMIVSSETLSDEEINEITSDTLLSYSQEGIFEEI